MLSSSFFSWMLYLALGATCVSALVLAFLLLVDWRAKELW